MPYTFDNNSKAGAPIAYGFTYGGTAVGWGSNNLMSMSDLSMRSQPLDGKFTVSELTTSFSDTDGAIWGSLGHGTVGIGSSWEATVYVGGAMDFTTFGPNESRLQRSNTNSSATYVIHKGRIVEIRRKQRMVTITSQNAMARVEDLEWVFPVAQDQIADGQTPAWNRQFGSNFIFNKNLLTGYATNYASAYFNLNADRDQFEVYCYVGPSLGNTLQHVYGTITGRGTIGLLASFCYPDTQFYSDFHADYDRVLFKGTFLGTRQGTISDLDTANLCGYKDVAEAESSKTGGSYIIMKSRLTFTGGTPSFPKGSAFYLQQGFLPISDTPANVWKELLTGCCVTPLFGSADIEPVTFATSSRNTAFQTVSQRVDPKGGKVLPYIKNLLEPMTALWSVDSQNRFMFQTYGPRTYQDVIGTIGMSELIDSEVSMDTDGKFNRVTIDYGFVFETGSYSRRVEMKGSGWGSTNDYPLVIQSKWLYQDNDVLITGSRLLNRFSRGVPRSNITVPLTRLSADVGSLFAITDSDMNYTTRVFEVTGWKKDFTKSRTLDLDMWDGDALYTNKGYSRWESGTLMTEAVSGTSQSGWGTSGTVNNINSGFFGSMFVWF